MFEDSRILYGFPAVTLLNKTVEEETCRFPPLTLFLYFAFRGLIAVKKPAQNEF